MAGGDEERPLVWLGGEIRTPPLSHAARVEAGLLLRRLQAGESIGMPYCRPMPSVGERCYELRIPDRATSWRIVFRLDADAVVLLEVFAKKTRATPSSVIQTCRRRLRRYEGRV
ncbi:MAG: type II toxin-antitoxin system RelE/ParE family toxin [Thermoanaerobaculia bacterium]